jgi:hypothetical protein
MATIPATQPESLTQRLFGLTVKNTAFVFALIYGAGFLIISIHHGRFGIDALEPFKPKVFSAGLLFVVLAGVPCIAMARVAGLFGLRMPTVRVLKNRGMGYIRLSWILGFWWIAIGLRMGSAVLFTGSEFMPGYPGWVFYLLAVGLSAIASHICDPDRNPLRTSIVEFGLLIFGVAIVFRYMSHPFFLQVLWFYIAGVAFLWIHSMWNSPQSQTYDWERNAFSILGLVLFFALSLYGHIRSVYGGGSPIRIEIVFNHPTLFSGGTTANGFLVDEDAHGYYVIHQEDEKEAHFVPREAVAEIVFHGERNSY